MKSTTTKTCFAFAILCSSFGACNVHAADTLNVPVGFSAVLTGGNAAFGKDIENGVQLALDDANVERIMIGGKVAHFQIHAEDDQGDPRIGVQAAQKLVDSGVAVVIGHFNSGTTLPASMIYQQAGIVMINPGATNPAINQRGLDHIFSVIGTDAGNAGLAGTYAVNVEKAKRISIIDDRTAFGQGEADVFEKAVKAAGGSIVARQYVNDKTVDFSSQLTALKAEDVDMVFFGGLDRQAAGVAKRMKQLGMKAQLLGGGAVADADFLQLAGNAGEGAMAWEPGAPLDRLPKGKDFAARYQKKFGTTAQTYAPFGYDAAWAAINAMQKADSIDPKVYLPVLKSISFDGITGHIAFDEKGLVKGAVSTLYQVKDGKWEPITTRPAD